MIIKMFRSNFRERMDRLADSISRNITPSLLLWTAFAVTVATTLLSMFFLTDVYRDVGNVYATGTRLFADGHFLEAMNPALPILQILIGGVISYTTALDPLKSLLLTCGIFYAALIPPLYFLLKRFLTPVSAAWGVLLTVCAPKLLRFSISGTPEPARNFFIVLLVYLIFRFFDKQTVGRTVLIGLALTGFTLSRSEGLLVSAALIPVLFCFLLRIHWNESWKSKLRTSVYYTFLTGFFFLLFLSPRMVQNYQITGYPTPDARLDQFIHAYLTPSRPLRDLSDNKQNFATVKVEESQHKFSIAKQVKLVLKQSSRGAYELYLGFAALGLLSLLFAEQLRKRFLPSWQPTAGLRKFRKEYLLIFIIWLLHSAVFFPVVIAYRYYIFLIPLLMPFTMTGLELLWILIRRFHLQIPAAAGTAFLLILQIQNGTDILFNRNSDNRKAGEWIRDHFKKGKDLRIFNRNSYVVYWIDGTIVNAYYEGPATRMECVKDFDVAIFETSRKDELRIFRSRKDVVELETPYAESVTVFRKTDHGQK